MSKTKCSLEAAARVRELAASGASNSAMAGDLGISPATLRNWILKGSLGKGRPYTDFARAYREGLSAFESTHRINIQTVALVKEDWRASSWLLERRMSEDWGLKVQVEERVQSELERFVGLLTEVLDEAEDDATWDAAGVLGLVSEAGERLG